MPQHHTTADQESTRSGGKRRREQQGRPLPQPTLERQLAAASFRRARNLYEGHWITLSSICHRLSTEQHLLKTAPVLSQVVFVGEWFSGWSELQRSDFLPSLLRELHPAHHINGGLPEHLSALSLGSNRPPSIFHCQVKLFHDWVSGWSSEERAKLVGLLRAADPLFGEKIDKAGAALDCGQQQEPIEQHQLEQPQRRCLDGSNGEQQQHDLEQQQQVLPPLQEAAAVAQQQLEPEAHGQLLEQDVHPPAPVAAAVMAPPAAGAGGHESDVDEALDSSASSTLSSPRPSEQHADSGLDSPVGGEAAEVDVEEDEGGHVVVMDDGAVPAAGDAAAARSDGRAAEEGGGGEGME